MDAGHLLVAVGLTAWVGGLAGAATFVSRRMRFPKSMYAGMLGGSPGWVGVISGLVILSFTAYSVPNVVWWFNLFASGVVAYGLAAYAVALTVERRRAIRYGLPEPGTAGTSSYAESAVFLAIAVPFAVAALALTGYGLANEVGGNRGEGGAGLGLGAMAWFLAIVMALFSSPLLLLLRRH